MSFHDVRLPLRFAFGSTGGPMRKTDIVMLASGGEQRNGTWAGSRRKYDAASAIKSLDDMAMLIEFFEARAGKLYGFRFLDPFDYKSCKPSGSIAPGDQVLGTGTGALATFNLRKGYTSGGITYWRPITRPTTGKVRVAVAGVEKTITTHFTVNTATGVVTFTGGNIPTNGQVVTAGFEFDVPVRFDTDELAVSMEAFKAGSIGQIPLIELPA